MSKTMLSEFGVRNIKVRNQNGSPQSQDSQDYRSRRLAESVSGVALLLRRCTPIEKNSIVCTQQVRHIVRFGRQKREGCPRGYNAAPFYREDSRGQKPTDQVTRCVAEYYGRCSRADRLLFTVDKNKSSTAWKRT